MRLVVTRCMRTFLLLVFLGATAYAQAPGMTEPVLMPPSAVTPVDVQPAQEEMIEGEPSYRYQTILADVAAIGLLAAAFETHEEGFGYTGLLTYALAAPVIHAVHGHGLRAAGSFGLRLALPFVGGFGMMAAFRSEYEGEDEAGLVGFMVGFGLGGISAMIIDSAFIARPTPAKRRRLTPTVNTTPGGATVGIAGTF